MDEHTTTSTSSWTYYSAGFIVLVTILISQTGGLRKNAFRVLGLYKQWRLLYLKLTGGRTEESEAERRVISGKVWEDFCESLKGAGASLVAPGCPAVSFLFGYFRFDLTVSVKEWV